MATISIPPVRDSALVFVPATVSVQLTAPDGSPVIDALGTTLPTEYTSVAIPPAGVLLALEPQAQIAIPYGFATWYEITITSAHLTEVYRVQVDDVLSPQDLRSLKGVAGITPVAIGAEPALTTATQAEMEAGTETALRSMSPQRVAQSVGGAHASKHASGGTDPVTPAAIGASRAMGMSSRDFVVYDDFDRSDRQLQSDTSPSGHQWSVTGPGAASCAISNGSLVGTDNYYASLPYGQAIDELGGAFSFGSGAGSNRDSMGMTLIADVSTSLLTMLHLNFGPNSWTLTKRVSGGSFVYIGNGTLRLMTDGSVYPIRMTIDSAAHTVTVHAPDGTDTTFYDADIGTAIQPQYATYQYTGDAGGGYKGAWHSVYIGPNTTEATRAMGGGAPLSALNQLYGSGLTKRATISGTFSGAGWYRIATAGVAITFAQIGSAKISATDPYRATFADVNFGTSYGDPAPPKLVQSFAHRVGDWPISHVRLSRDDTTYAIGLDVYVPNNDLVTYSIDLFGVLTDIVPTPGAVALPTASTVLSLVP